jgi:hypothetical protein
MGKLFAGRGLPRQVLPEQWVPAFAGTAFLEISVTFTELRRHSTLFTFRRRGHQVAPFGLQLPAEVVIEYAHECRRTREQRSAQVWP